MRVSKGAHLVLMACLLVSTGAVSPACRSPTVAVGSSGGTGNVGISPAAGGAGGALSGGGGSSSSSIFITIPEAGGSPAGSGGSTVDAYVLIDGKSYSCDDAGNCSCLAILSLGQPGAYGSASGVNGVNGDTNEFQTYMNTNTNGKMTMIRHSPR